MPTSHKKDVRLIWVNVVTDYHTYIYQDYFYFATKVHGTLQLDHSNLACVMIILFVNIKLLIDSCLSKGFPGVLHEALRQCIGMILALRVYVRVAQSVEYVATYGKFFISGHSGFEFQNIFLFFILFLFLILFHYRL